MLDEIHSVWLAAHDAAVLQHAPDVRQIVAERPVSALHGALELVRPKDELPVRGLFLICVLGSGGVQARNQVVTEKENLLAVVWLMESAVDTRENGNDKLRERNKQIIRRMTTMNTSQKLERASSHPDTTTQYTTQNHERHSNAHTHVPTSAPSTRCDTRRAQSAAACRVAASPRGPPTKLVVVQVLQVHRQVTDAQVALYGVRQSNQPPRALPSRPRL